MKIRNILIALLIAPTLSWANNNVELVVSTNFNANLTNLFWFSTEGDVRGDGENPNSVTSRETNQISMTANTDCLNNPMRTCSNGNFSVHFLYSKHRTQLCEYQYNVYTQKGSFIFNSQAVVADDEKPITCYAKTLPGYLFIFVKNVQ